MFIEHNHRILNTANIISVTKGKDNDDQKLKVFWLTIQYSSVKYEHGFANLVSYADYYATESERDAAYDRLREKLI